MVATFVEAAGSGEDAEIARPTWAEIRGVLALAVRTRLGGAGAVPRACAWGEGARVFALAAVLIQAVFAAFTVWGALHGYVLASAAQRRARTAMSGPPTPRDLELWLAPAVWIVVYLAVVLGRWRAARWFALAAAIQTLYGLDGLLGGRGPVAGTPDAIAMAAGLGVLPAVLSCHLHQDAAPVPRTGPLIALPAGVTLIGLWTHLTGPEHAGLAGHTRSARDLLLAAPGGQRRVRDHAQGHRPAAGARLAAGARAAGSPDPRRAGLGAGRVPRRAAGPSAGLAEHADHDRCRPGRHGRPGYTGAPDRCRPHPTATARPRNDRQPRSRARIARIAVPPRIQLTAARAARELRIAREQTRRTHAPRCTACLGLLSAAAERFPASTRRPAMGANPGTASGHARRRRPGLLRPARGDAGPRRQATKSPRIAGAGAGEVRSGQSAAHATSFSA